MFEPLVKLRSDLTYTREKAAKEIADMFCNTSKMAEYLADLPSLYMLLRVEPILSKLLFEELISRHNDSVTSNTGNNDINFIACCCCCGIDPYHPESSLTDIDRIEEAAVKAQNDERNISAYLAEYRKLMHNSSFPPAAQEKSKRDKAKGLFARLTCATIVEKEEAEYIFAVIQHNECIGELMFEMVIAGAQFATLTNMDTTQFDDSMVLKAIVPLFNEGGGEGGGGGSNGGGGGGGGCCCCCCCCCGGGC